MDRAERREKIGLAFKFQVMRKQAEGTRAYTFLLQWGGVLTPRGKQGKEMDGEDKVPMM